MPTKPQTIKLSQAEQAALWIRAEAQDEAGNFLSAFRLYLRGAKSGNTSMMTNLALFYDYGKGVAVDKQRALYWNIRAYRKGSSMGAVSAALVMRDLGRFDDMLLWLQRAVDMGDVGANLELAFYWLRSDRPLLARNHARKVLRAKRSEVSQLEKEMAYWMLHGLESAGKIETRQHPVFKNYKP